MSAGGWRREYQWHGGRTVSATLLGQPIQRSLSETGPGVTGLPAAGLLVLLFLPAFALGVVGDVAARANFR